MHDVFTDETENLDEENKNPMGGKYNLSPKPTPTLLTNTDTD